MIDDLESKGLKDLMFVVLNSLNFMGLENR